MMMSTVTPNKKIIRPRLLFSSLRLSIQRKNDSSKISTNDETEVKKSYVNNPLHNDVIDTIKNREWKRLLNDLSGSSLKQLNEIIRADRNFEGTPILHFILQYEPPISVVSKVTTEFPESLFQRDSLDRTPLHAALAHGASRFVVAHIVKCHPKACNIGDKSGKTPLHVCIESLAQYDELSDMAMEIVETLVYSSPSSLDVEDEEGVCALEAAILLEAPYRVVTLLQRVKRCHLIKDSMSKSCTGRFVDVSSALASSEEDTQRRRSSVSGAMTAQSNRFGF